MSNDEATERFSELYTTFYGRVRAYAARRVGPDAADEVAVELRFEADLARYGTTSHGASPARPRRAATLPAH